MMDMPSMDSEPMNDMSMDNDDVNGGMGDGTLDMGNGDMGQDNMGFDETDPKKSIQSLTGKLSQELRNYNNSQEKPDIELNKYVAGMIIPQASKSLTNNDKSEIIKKINSNPDSDEENMNMGDENDMSIDTQMEDSIPSESRKMINNIIDEMVNSILKDNNNDRYEKKTGNNVKRKNPFVANR